MGTKAVSYLRVSGAGQVGGDGFPRQRIAVGKYAKANKVEIVHEYVEGGVSGTNELADREALTELYERLAANGVRCVLVENATRLARDLMVQETILDKFRRLGVEVIACDAGQDLTVLDGDPTRTMIRQILGSFAQFEKATLVAKLRGSRERKRRDNGRCEGRKPFGTREGEQAVLDRIKELSRKPRGGDRLSTQAIADKLNEEGLPTRTGKPWSKGTVHQILRRS